MTSASGLACAPCGAAGRPRCQARSPTKITVAENTPVSSVTLDSGLRVSIRTSSQAGVQASTVTVTAIGR